MSTSAFQQDCGLSSGTVSSRNLVYPGGIQIGNVYATSGKISHPQFLSKTDAGTLTASNLVNSLIVAVNPNPLTLSIPTVEAILAEFALQSRTFAVGDQFEVTIAHSTVGAGALTLDAAVVAGEHSVTFASGVAPVNLTQAGGTLTHCVKLLFEITSLTTPSIRVNSIVG